MTGIKSGVNIQVTEAGGDASPVPPTLIQTGGLGHLFKKTSKRKNKFNGEDYVHYYIRISAFEKMLLNRLSLMYNVTVNKLIFDHIKMEAENMNYTLEINRNLIEDLLNIKDELEKMKTVLHIVVTKKFSERYNVEELVRNFLEKMKSEVI